MGTIQLLSVPYSLFSERTSESYTAGYGIDITDDIVTNTLPDQEIVMNSDAGISVSGEYPEFALTNAAPNGFLLLFPRPHLAGP